MIIARRHLRSDVTAEVEQRLLSGRLPVGRINESELADELGISRTPLREALLVMEQRGLVESALGRGFLVRPLSLDDAEELYPLLAVLEPMAIRLGIATLQKQAPGLRELLQRLGRESEPDALMGLSQEWSAKIVAACPNRTLATLLQDLYRLSARYERHNIESIGAADGFALEPALARHHAIVDALEAGDGDRAAELIGASWQDCLDVLRINLAAPTAATA